LATGLSDVRVARRPVMALSGASEGKADIAYASDSAF
jgi:hypothetical protein